MWCGFRPLLQQRGPDLGAATVHLNLRYYSFGVNFFSPSCLVGQGCQPTSHSSTVEPGYLHVAQTLSKSLN